jgi:nucleolar protein 9
VKRDSATVLFYMTHPTTSHAIESMLSPALPVPLRRKLVNHILGSVVPLATSPTGSHIVDAAWDATQDIRFQKEKIAKEMSLQGDVVRNDFFGKRVWRNWRMGVYVVNEGEWRSAEGEGKYAKRPVVVGKKGRREGSREGKSEGKKPFG